MTLCRCQVDKPALGQQVDLSPVREQILVDLLTNMLTALGHLVEFLYIDLDIEMPRVRHDRAIFHQLEMFLADHRDISSQRDEYIAYFSSLHRSHHEEPVHHGLESFYRIDLDDDHVGSHAPCSHRGTASTPAVSEHDDPGTGKESIRSTDHSVDRTLTGTVPVIKEMFRHSIVDGDHRVLQHTSCLHRSEPDHAGRGLFRTTDDVLQQIPSVLMHQRYEIGSVVHRDLGFQIKRGIDVLVICVVILTPDSEGGDLVILYERRNDLVLGAERVGSTESHFRSTGL